MTADALRNTPEFIADIVQPRRHWQAGNAALYLGNRHSIENMIECFELRTTACPARRQLTILTITLRSIWTVIIAARFFAHLTPILGAQRRGHFVVLGSVAGDRGRLENYLLRLDRAALHPWADGLRARPLFGIAVTMAKPALTLGHATTTAGRREAVRPGLRQGNPPQSSKRRCPVLVVEDHSLDRLLPASILKEQSTRGALDRWLTGERT